MNHLVSDDVPNILNNKKDTYKKETPTYIGGTVMKRNIGSIIFVAAAAGFTAGMMLEKRNKKRPLTPEKVLDLVKKSLQNKLPVNGAWIFLSPHEVTRNDLKAYAYQGGLTVKKGEGVEHYDFVADAETGSLIDLKGQR